MVTLLFSSARIGHPVAVVSVQVGKTDPWKEVILAKWTDIAEPCRSTWKSCWELQLLGLFQG